MERVTQWFGDETHGREAGLADKYDGVYLDDELIQVLLNRLATYEDTGMTPEEIKRADEILKENWEMPLERLVEGMELIMAKDSGRLVVLPCKAGDTIYQLRDKRHARGVGISPRIVSYVGVWRQDYAAFHQGAVPCYKEDFNKTWFLTQEEAEAALSGATQ